MHKPKYPKKNLRNPKHINPDSNQRKSSEGEKEHLNNVAWVARGLGSPSWVAQPGSRKVVVYLGCAQWSEADLKPPTSIAHSHLPVSFYFWFFFFFSLGSSSHYLIITFFVLI